jgi:hypothetical protein
MRGFQFWILVLGSSLVSILLIKQIFLNHALRQEQRLLVDSQEAASNGPAFESAWKQLAVHIYQVGRQDPALLQVLKKENVGVHPNPNAGSALGAPPSAPAVPSKSPVGH